MSSTINDVESFLNGYISLTSLGLWQIDFEENFQVIKELGTGGYGSVLLVKYKKAGQQMALKLMKKSRTSERKFLMEYSMSFFLSSHPNIIGGVGMALKTEDHFAFAQEVAPVGDLCSLIIPHVGLPEDAVKRCARQISSALGFIADKGLVHMDIKPANVLVFDQECHSVKITDFGLARFQATAIRSKCGTASYMAPEIHKLTGEEELAVASTLDVWAFGVLLYCLITGEIPWKVAMAEDEGFNRFVIWQNNLHCKDPPPSWTKLPESVQKMLNCLLAVDYSQRSKSAEILIYLEESWKSNSTLNSPDQKTSSSKKSSTISNDSSSSYESESTSTSCQYSATESSRSYFDMRSLFVGAEVDLT